MRKPLLRRIAYHGASMNLPVVTDTVLALATAWQPAPLAILRLSGPDCFEVAAAVGIMPPADKTVHSTRGNLQLVSSAAVPVEALWFRAPRSYTGQNLVELHTVGALPWLRELSSRLLAAGARRALPGEFTARAYLAGKLRPEAVNSILDLIHADDDATARRAARVMNGAPIEQQGRLAERLAALLARVEAGIDFVDEEDVRFICAEAVATELAELQAQADRLHAAAGRGGRGRPHVALAGLPNAGKSTLFNALVGYRRAIVSPVLGTTRDVLSAEVAIGEQVIMLQDCAGLGHTPTDLDLAAHRAAEQTTAHADVVLWVHAADTPWEAAELEALSHLPRERIVLVESKAELAGARDGKAEPCRAKELPPGAPECSHAVRVSAITGLGLDRLREVLPAALAAAMPIDAGDIVTDVPALAAALERAQRQARADSALAAPELLAHELRAALRTVRSAAQPALADELLGRIFTQFCIGK